MPEASYIPTKAAHGSSLYQYKRATKSGVRRKIQLYHDGKAEARKHVIALNDH
jgi:hypothetical protein